VFHEGLKIQILQDIIGLKANSVMTIVFSNPAHTHFVVDSEQHIKMTLTDNLYAHLKSGICQVVGNKKLFTGSIYLYHRIKKYVVPIYIAQSETNKPTIVVYRSIGKTLKSSHRLSDRSYYTTMEEFYLQWELIRRLK
jgi:hypothetical protein